MHSYSCGQTVRWIKMPLCKLVGLGLGHIVRWGPSSIPQQLLPTFGPCLLWPNGRPSQQLLSSCCTAHARESLYFTMDRPFLFLNCPFAWGDLDHHLTRGSWAHPSPHPKRHLDRLSRFARLTIVTDLQIERPSDRQTTLFGL